MAASMSPATSSKMAARASSDLSIDFALPPLSADTIGVTFSLEPGTLATPTRCVRTASRTIFTGSCPLRACRGATGELLSTTVRANARNNTLKVHWTGSRLKIFPDIPEESGYLLQQSPDDTDCGRVSFFLEKLSLARRCLAPVLRDIIRRGVGEEGGSSSDARARMHQQALMSAQLLDEVTEAMNRSTKEKVTIDLSTPGVETRTLVTGPGLVSVETTVVDREPVASLNDMHASQQTRNTDREHSESTVDECYPIELYDFEKKCMKPSDSIERMLSQEYERVLCNVNLDQLESRHGDVWEERDELSDRAASSRTITHARDAASVTHDNDSLKMYRAYHAAVIHRMIRLRDVLGEITDSVEKDATFSISSSQDLERSAGGNPDVDAAGSRGMNAERNQGDFRPYGQEIADYRLEDQHSLELNVSNGRETPHVSKYARERSSLTDTILTAREKIIDCLGQMIQARESLLLNNSDDRLDHMHSDSVNRVGVDEDEGKENYEENKDSESRKLVGVKSSEDKGSVLSALETRREDSEGREGDNFGRDSIRNVVLRRKKSDASKVSSIYVNTRFGRGNKRERTVDERETVEDDRERQKNRNTIQGEKQSDERLPFGLKSNEQQVSKGGIKCSVRNSRNTDNDCARKLNKHEKKKKRSVNRSKSSKNGSREDSAVDSGCVKKKSGRSPTAVVMDSRQRKKMCNERNREKSRKRNASAGRRGDDYKRSRSENQDDDRTEIRRRHGDRRRQGRDYVDADDSLIIRQRCIEKRNSRSEKNDDDASDERRRLYQGQRRRCDNDEVKSEAGKRRFVDKERRQIDYMDDVAMARRRQQVNKQRRLSENDDDDAMAERRRFSERRNEPSDNDDDATRPSSCVLREANTDDRGESRLSRLKDRVKKFYRRISSAESDSQDREHSDIDRPMLDSAQRRDSTEELLARGMRTKLDDRTLPGGYGKRTTGRREVPKEDDGRDTSLESRGDLESVRYGTDVRRGVERGAKTYSSETIFRPRGERCSMNYRCEGGGGSTRRRNTRADDMRDRRRFKDLSEDSYGRRSGLTHREHYSGKPLHESVERSQRGTNGNRDFVRHYYEPLIDSLCDRWNTEVDNDRRPETSHGNIYKQRKSAKSTCRKTRHRKQIKSREFKTQRVIKPRVKSASNETIRRLSGSEESDSEEEKEARSRTDAKSTDSVRHKLSPRETEKKQEVKDEKLGYVILENNPMQPSIAKFLNKKGGNHENLVQQATNNQNMLGRRQVGTKVPVKRDTLERNLLVTRVEPQQCYQNCDSKRWLEFGQSSTRNQLAKARPQTTTGQSYQLRDLEKPKKDGAMLEETGIPLNIETPSSYVIISRSQIFNNSVVLSEAASAITRKGPNQIIENYVHTVSPLIVSTSDHQRQMRTWERGEKASEDARISKSVVGSISCAFRVKQANCENDCTSVKLGTMNLQNINIASDDAIKRNGVYVVSSQSGETVDHKHGKELKTSSQGNLNGTCPSETSATTVPELRVDYEMDSESLLPTSNYKCRLFRADKYPRTRYINEESTRVGSGSRRRVSTHREQEAERRLWRREASRDRDVTSGAGRSTQRSRRDSRKNSIQSLAVSKRSAEGRREYLKGGVEEMSDHSMRVDRCCERRERESLTWPSVTSGTRVRRKRKSRKACNEVTIMKTVFESDEEADQVVRREAMRASPTTSGERLNVDRKRFERENGVPRPCFDSHVSRDFKNKHVTREDSFSNASIMDREAREVRSRDVADDYYRPRLDKDYKDGRTSTSNTCSRHLCVNMDRPLTRRVEKYLAEQESPPRSCGKEDWRARDETDRLSIKSADSLSVESLQKVVDRVNTIMRARWLQDFK